MYVLGSCLLLVAFAQVVPWTSCLSDPVIMVEPPGLYDDSVPSIDPSGEGHTCRMGLTCSGGSGLQVELPVQGITGPMGPPGLPGFPGEMGLPGSQGINAQEGCRIAFHATLNGHKNYDNAVDGNQPLLFDTVVTNHGNAFNASTSTFNSPFNATYILHATVSAKEGKEAAVDLYHNDEHLGRLHADSKVIWGSVSNAFILDMGPGDTVRIVMNNQFHHFYGNGYNSFSGVCLWDAESEDQLEHS